MRAAWAEARQRMVPRQRRWASPLDMAVSLDPARISDTGERVGTVRTPALNVVNDALVRLANKPGQGRLAVFLSPQEGKSTTCSYWNPLWLLVNNPDLRIIAVSYNAEKSPASGAPRSRTPSRTSAAMTAWKTSGCGCAPTRAPPAGGRSRGTAAGSTVRGSSPALRAGRATTSLSTTPRKKSSGSAVGNETRQGHLDLPRRDHPPHGPHHQTGVDPNPLA